MFTTLGIAVHLRPRNGSMGVNPFLGKGREREEVIF